MFNFKFNNYNHDTTNASKTLDILYDEFQQIHDPDQTDFPQDQVLDDAFVYGALHSGYPRTALCLSGGGIRSAAFGLGILEWLAQSKLLSSFQYLSTVSGGGYIGSWLSAWIARSPDGYASIESKLSPRDRKGQEPEEITHLRENTRYLTQRAGILSGDLWATIAISLRNVFLNWCVILPFIAAFVLIPEILVMILYEMDKYSIGSRIFLPVIVIIVIFCSMYFTYNVDNLPRWAIENNDNKSFRNNYLVPQIMAAYIWTILLTLDDHTDSYLTLLLGYVIIAIIMLLVVWIFRLIFRRHAGDQPFVKIERVGKGKAGSKLFLEYAVTLSRPATSIVRCEIFTEDRRAVATKHYIDEDFVVEFECGEDKRSIFVELIPQAANLLEITPRDVRLIIRKCSGARAQVESGGTSTFYGIVGLLVSSICFSAILASAHFGATHILNTELKGVELILLFTFAPPAFLLANFIAQTIFVGATSKTSRSEEDREWLGRAGGQILFAATIWCLVSAAVLLLPMIPFKEIIQPISTPLASPTTISALISIAAIASGLLAAFIGNSAKTPSHNSKASKFSNFFLASLIVLFLAALIEQIVFVTNLSIIGCNFIDRLGSKTDCYDRNALVSMTLFSILLFIIGMLATFFVNVNRFSLHSMYRNRLVRAFLGASVDESAKYRVNKFTGFSEAHNMELQRLWERSDRKPKGKRWRPFHLVNMALNVGLSSNLAQQERKAESFVASPLWCGCGSNTIDAYRRTSEYGGANRTITLGTAMAISGAAVSPNMGYNSSPLLAIILTLFNLRLGWWFGNPINSETYKLEGPRFGIGALMRESFNRTQSTTPYVYLSDGGHFENLGVYEVVRRRCHFILISDAGHDPDCDFADLSNAVRRISVDFGIPITFPYLSRIPSRKNDNITLDDTQVNFAIGVIDYRAVDGEAAKQGLILYVKPALLGDEPVDVVGYSRNNKDFPHENTMNQWFTEAQFESYRSLAYASMEKIDRLAERYSEDLAGAVGERPQPNSTLDRFFSALRRNLKEKRSV